MSMREFAPVMLAIYFCSSFIFNDFGIPIALSLLLLIAILMLEIIEVLLDRGIIRYNKILNNPGIMVVLTVICSFKWYGYDSTKAYYLIVMIVAYLIIVLSRFDVKTVNRIGRVFIFFGFVISTLIYFYFISPDLYRNIFYPFIVESVIDYNNRITALGYSIGVYGDITYTLLQIMFGLLFVIFNGNDLKKPLRIFYVIYCGIAVFIGQRRTEPIAFVASILLMLLFIYWRDVIKYFSRHIIAAFLILILMAGVVAFYIYYRYFSAITYSKVRLIQTLIELRLHKDIGNGRTALRNLAENILKDNWLWGIGWMNFSHFAGQTGNTIARNVHNIYLQLIVECGVVFGTLYIFALINTLVRCIRLTIKRNNISVGCAIIFYVMIAGLADNTIYYPYFWTFFMIAIYICSTTGDDIWKN